MAVATTGTAEHVTYSEMKGYKPEKALAKSRALHLCLEYLERSLTLSSVSSKHSKPPAAHTAAPGRADAQQAQEAFQSKQGAKTRDILPSTQESCSLPGGAASHLALG